MSFISVTFVASVHYYDNYLFLNCYKAEIVFVDVRFELSFTILFTINKLIEKLLLYWGNYTIQCMSVYCVVPYSQRTKQETSKNSFDFVVDEKYFHIGRSIHFSANVPTVKSSLPRLHQNRQ